MLKSRFSFVGLLIFIGLYSCTPSVEVQNIDQTETFFDLKEFFRKELKQLESIKAFEKTVQINDQEEKKKVSELNLSRELATFSEKDINRLAWKDKYVIDSITNSSGELLRIVYQATNEDMKTQTLQVSFSDSLVDSILIDNQVTGFATQNQQEMVYVPKHGYHIKSKQRTLLGTEQKIRVEVKFLMD